MRKYNIIRSMVPVAAAGLLLVGCHEDVDMPSTSPSEVESENGKITSFTLRQGHFSFPDEVGNVTITLISKEGVTHCFDATVDRESGELRFHMHVPSSESVSDGDYVLTMSREDGRSIPGRLSARFDDGLLTTVGIIIPSYMLDGSGTEEDPYLIQSDDDFGMFLINLSDDKDVYGAGLKFKQTADVIAPDQSSLIPGRGYWGAPFAGIYDGGGHTIRGLYYRGNGREGSDSGIGLFTSLLGSASIEHLSMTGVGVTGIYKESGTIAGVVNGNVTLSDIIVNGYFEDGYAIGGLVGCVTNGTLTVKNVELQIAVEGTNDVGGLIGRVDDKATLIVDGVSTPTTHFSVTGNKSVGGIAGRTKGKAVISNVQLDHKVSSEDSDISIINGNVEGTGGIIGTITAEAQSHTITNCHVTCPVGGKGNNVGGIIGQAMLHNTLEFDDCRMYSVVKGGDCVGGFIGKADIPSNTKGIVLKGDNFSNRVAADDADAKVSGNENVGGFCGYLSAPFTLESKVRINVPVNGSTNTGGAFGHIYNTTVDASRIELGPTSGDNTMKVVGTTSTGGVVGYMEKSTLTGSSKFDYAENGNPIKVPSSDRFTPQFDGVVDGSSAVGGLIGYARDSKVQYLNSAVMVTGKKDVGGVVGSFLETGESSRIEDCSFKGHLQCSDAENVGGIVGYYESRYAGKVSDCVNYSDITGGMNTGGIIGYVEKNYPSIVDMDHRLTIGWCVNMGKVVGQLYVGGVVGHHTTPTLSDSYISCTFTISDSMNRGKVTGSGNSTSTGGVGGIIGFSGAYVGVYKCANHGEIYGRGPFHGIGGIAGSVGKDPTGITAVTGYMNADVCENCNTATVNADDRSSFVGGIVGYQEEGENCFIKDCHNMGSVPCDQNHDSGGIVGCVDHLTNQHKCVNQGKVSHGNAIVGTHKSGSLFNHGSIYFLEGTGKGWPSATSVSAANFTKQSSFSGLDFNKIWQMGNDGPVLRNCQWRDAK